MTFALNICVPLSLFPQEKLQQMELFRSKGRHVLVASNAYYQNVLQTVFRVYITKRIWMCPFLLYSYRDWVLALKKLITENWHIF